MIYLVRFLDRGYQLLLAAAHVARGSAECRRSCWLRLLMLFSGRGRGTHGILRGSWLRHQAHWTLPSAWPAFLVPPPPPRQTVFHPKTFRCHRLQRNYRRHPVRRRSGALAARQRQTNGRAARRQGTRGRTGQLPGGRESASGGNAGSRHAASARRTRGSPAPLCRPRRQSTRRSKKSAPAWWTSRQASAAASSARCCGIGEAGTNVEMNQFGQHAVR